MIDKLQLASDVTNLVSDVADLRERAFSVNLLSYPSKHRQYHRDVIELLEVAARNGEKLLERLESAEGDIVGVKGEIAIKQR